MDRDLIRGNSLPLIAIIMHWIFLRALILCLSNKIAI